MERKRPAMYYLDEARHGSYVLHADESVGILETEQRQEQIEVATRIPGKTRLRTISYMASSETAHFRDLPHLVREHPVPFPTYDIPRCEDALEFVPASTISRMEKWRRRFDSITHESIVEAAQTMIANDESLQTAQVHCADCADDKYACYTSGWSKYFWEYPMIDVVVGDKHQFVPFDAARAIATCPDALQLDMAFSLTHGDQLHAQYFAVLDMSKLTQAYIGGDEQPLVIDRADRLSGAAVQVHIGQWYEDRTLHENSRAYTQRQGGKITVADDVVRTLQTRIAQGGERVEIADYDVLWAKVRTVLGQKGLALTWDYKYFGMGDSGAVVKAVRPDTLEHVGHVTEASESRMMVDDVYRKLVQGIQEPLHGRPIY